MDHQLPPDGDWRTWVIMGGRGAGKTRAGSEWIRSQVEGSLPSDPGRCKRVALIGETFDQARDVMVFGDSGILACSPPDRRPKWIATRRMLEWPNGAQAQVFSAHDYEGLRGPQFDCAWADELAKWPKAEEAWDMLQFGLRLGDHPQQLVTTTPRSIQTLRNIIDSPSTVLTRASTEANRANLAESFLEDIRRRYKDSRLERQELDGVMLESVDGAIWSYDHFRAAPKGETFDRVLVAVDPSVSNGPNSDLCGICVVGIRQSGHPTEWTATVLADVSVKPDSPGRWAEAVVQAYYDYDAHEVVAEVNQGGDLIVTMVNAIDNTVPVKKVHARKSKSRRAEPVALLYDQGRVRHRTGLSELEDQLCLMTRHGFRGQGSPDRVDALVWALTVGIIVPMQEGGRPGVRRL